VRLQGIDRVLLRAPQWVSYEQHARWPPEVANLSLGTPLQKPPGYFHVGPDRSQTRPFFLFLFTKSDPNHAARALHSYGAGATDTPAFSSAHSPGPMRNTPADSRYLSGGPRPLGPGASRAVARRV
jgi:hypothetical protein